MRKILLKCKGVLLGTLIVVCLSGCGKDTTYYVDSEQIDITETKEEVSSEPETETEIQSVYVYICGQVLNPGVYVLPEGSRVCDVLALAGGFTSEAATEYWNQARVLSDGEMIYIPSLEEAAERQIEGETSRSKSTDEQDDNKVNINTASKEELMSIPGIGEAKAMAIIAYREENGPFSSLEELMNVAGIKDGVFSKMKEYIKIN